MPKVRNISPLGGLLVPALRAEVGAGEVIEVSEEMAEALLQQPDTWEQVEEPKAVKPAAK